MTLKNITYYLLLVVALAAATSFGNPAFAQGPPPPDRQVTEGEPIGQQQPDSPVIGDPNPYPKAQSPRVQSGSRPVIREYHTTTVVRQPVYINTGPTLADFQSLKGVVVSDRKTLQNGYKAINRHEQLLRAVYDTDVAQNGRLATVEGNVATLTEAQKRDKDRFEAIEAINLWQWAAFAAFIAATTVVGVVMFIISRRRQAANQAVTITP